MSKQDLIKLLQEDAVQILLCEVDLRETGREVEGGFKEYERTGTYQIVIRDTRVPLEASAAK